MVRGKEKRGAREGSRKIHKRPNWVEVMESVESRQLMIFNDKRGNRRNIERFELLAFRHS